MLKNISLLNSSRNYYPKYSRVKKLHPEISQQKKESIFKNARKIISNNNKVEETLVKSANSNKKRRSAKRQSRNKKRSLKREIVLGKNMIKTKYEIISVFSNKGDS